MCKIYVHNWFTCNIAAYAPRNDLELIKSLRNYKNVNTKISEGCLGVFERHGWYISDILVGLAFFDDRIEERTKLRMVRALANQKGNDDDEFRNTSMVARNEIDIVSLVSQKTLKLFRILSGTEFVGFLDTPPDEWKNDSIFAKMHSIVNNLAVVNDPAERAIGLIKQLNNTRTADQAKQNALIQVVEQFRKQYPNKNKSSFQLN